MNIKEIITQTKQLVAIPSTVDNPGALREAVEFIASILNQCPNVTVERFERNEKPSLLAYRGNSRPHRFSVLLNAHVDVVAAAAEKFTVVEKEGKLYGRGVLDMKGTALVLTHLFCETVNAVDYPLGIQIVSDEEIGGYDGAKLQIDQGVQAEFVIIGEYTNDRNTLYNAARGVCWSDITFRGKEAHGGHLWHGSNAVLRAADFARAILEHYPIPDKETWTTTASVANLHTPNETFNKVPAEASLKIDFRFVKEDPVFASKRALQAFIGSIDPGAELSAVSVFEPAVFVPESNPYVQALATAMEGVTGHTIRFRGRPASSDGRHFTALQSGVVEFGLYGRGSHSDQEYVEISSFVEYRAILHKFLSNPDGIELAPHIRQSDNVKNAQSKRKLTPA